MRLSYIIAAIAFCWRTSLIWILISSASTDLEQLMSLYAWFIAPRWRERHVWNWLMDTFIDMTDLYDRTPELRVRAWLPFLSLFSVWVKCWTVCQTVIIQTSNNLNKELVFACRRKSLTTLGYALDFAAECLRKWSAICMPLDPWQNTSLMGWVFHEVI